MKQVVLRFLHVFMALVVLLSSMGFGLVDHTCQMRGKRTYLIQQRSKACKVCSSTHEKPLAGPVLKRSACCQEKARYEKIDTGSSLNHVLVKFISVLADAVGPGLSAVFVAFLGLFSVHTVAPLGAIADPPAPPAGRALLVLVHSFLI
ncbi:HYC_CC_PP family protein [Fibrella aquatilis]|uniref:Uncharacterized protein n=1 Tax=Fibrella aquatilis TaxID=2817059 RepID=A0A939G1W4_9BACT|nr:hypothetical protein [Fibrella aquatilis]MBO0929555.1 hypothetical protein [Fibrella aquatilis]